MVDLETEAEPEHKLTPRLRKTAAKTNLLLELIFKTPLMELQKPRQFSSSLSRTLLQTLTAPTCVFEICCLTRVQANPQCT